jgi:two-component system cell cycle response regulator CpdR
VASSEKTALRVLLVDDEAMVRDSVRRFLTYDGHQVETASSGSEALLAIQQNKFDVVITDYEMPGMKGDKLAAAIKALLPDQPIILITAYTESLRGAGEFPLAVDLMISKPFDVEEFRRAVRRVAASRGGSQPACQ